MAYNLYDLKNALEYARDNIDDAIYNAEELEDYEERVEELEERVEELEEEIDGYRDASNLQEIITWWLNNLSKESKSKVWELAYQLMKEEQKEIEITINQVEE